MVIVDSGDPDTVAAYDASTHTIVLVTVNDAARAVTYDLSAFPMASGPVSHWSTGSEHKYTHQTDRTLEGKTFRVSLAANTVHTFAVHGVYLAPPSAVADVFPALRNAAGAASGAPDASAAHPDDAAAVARALAGPAARR
jgi:hypothetical protein